MKKLKLLLFDANVVIELFRQGIWDKVVERCEIYLSRTVVEVEVKYWEEETGKQHRIDLHPYIEEGDVKIFDVSLSEIQSYRSRFGSMYFEKLDPGETESLVYLEEHQDRAKICSADKIVYRILGNIQLSGKGISLEEILDSIGLGRSLGHAFGKEYRLRWSKKGFEEGMRDLGRK